MPVPLTRKRLSMSCPLPSPAGAAAAAAGAGVVASDVDGVLPVATFRTSSSESLDAAGGGVGPPEVPEAAGLGVAAGAGVGAGAATGAAGVAGVVGATAACVAAVGFGVGDGGAFSGVVGAGAAAGVGVATGSGGVAVSLAGASGCAGKRAGADGQKTAAAVPAARMTTSTQKIRMTISTRPEAEGPPAIPRRNCWPLHARGDGYALHRHMPGLSHPRTPR